MDDIYKGLHWGGDGIKYTQNRLQELTEGIDVGG